MFPFSTLSSFLHCETGIFGSIITLPFVSFPHVPQYHYSKDNTENVTVIPGLLSEIGEP